MIEGNSNLMRERHPDGNANLRESCFIPKLKPLNVNFHRDTENIRAINEIENTNRDNNSVRRLNINLSWIEERDKIELYVKIVIIKIQSDFLNPQVNPGLDGLDGLDDSNGEPGKSRNNIDLPMNQQIQENNEPNELNDQFYEMLRPNFDNPENLVNSSQRI